MNWEVVVHRLLFFIALIVGITPCFAQQEMTPDGVIAEHLKSLGNAQVVGATNKAFLGEASAAVYQGGTGSMVGTAMLVSDGPKVSIVAKFNDINYPGEYFAFDGKEVSVGHISPGQRSPIADFLFRYNPLIKDGLLGGVLSGAWPLLNIAERQVDLKYKLATIDGKPLHEIEYQPKNYLRDMKIKLYFDTENFRHVRTEYRVRIRDDMSTQASGSIGGFIGGQAIADSIYVMIEKFDDFKKVGVMVLPHRYSIDYSVEGQSNAFVGKWTLNAQQWFFNRPYDERIFKAQK